MDDEKLEAWKSKVGTSNCPRCGVEMFPGHRGYCRDCARPDDYSGSFEAPPPGPRQEWQIRVTPIEFPTTEAEYRINREALSVALKGVKNRREAGEPRGPYDVAIECIYLTSAIGYLDPETFDVIEDRHDDR